MKLVVGLGNPGPRYETTRHNVGFLIVDSLVDRWKCTGPNNKFRAEVYQGDFKGEKIALIKPQTFMNLSGASVAEFFNFYKCTPTDLIVIHDDLDLPPLGLRIKTGGGTGGHNGLKSIDEHLGAANNGYHRVRVGIGKPIHGDGSDHVLGQFNDDEIQQLNDLLDPVGEAIELVLAGKVSEAMTKYNGLNRR